MDQFRDWAKEVIEIESRAVLGLIHQLDEQFSAAIQMILDRRGKVAVLGMGKSGIIGKKIAATLSSTGTASFFIHPSEAIHGDLGMLGEGDCVLAISRSGESNEILQLLPYFKEHDFPIIAFTGERESTLGHEADFVIQTKVESEACPHDLAPTSSSTASLVMGDALSIALMKARNFLPEEFAKFHPGGSLGKRLITKVEDVMRTDHLPVIGPESLLPEVVMSISQGRLGLAVVVDADQLIIGVITDGDIRRAMEGFQQRFFSSKAMEIMTLNPKIVHPDRTLIEAEKLMNRHKINSLLVTERGKLLGVIQIYQIPV
ncbi:MAG: KpsF/GutQ family sugar-phosphate isomerase [Bacteroidota bacterium]